MPTFYIRGQKHTLASALREILEENYNDDFVACSVLHPDDEHIVVEAPTEASLRESLLRMKDKLACVRKDIK